MLARYSVVYVYQNSSSTTMSGAEAGFAIGLISGLISIIEATKTVYDAARDAKGQPEAFRQVAARLPVVVEILQSAKRRAQNLNEMEQEALEPVIESCEAKAESLNKLFRKVIQKDDDKWYDRYKKAIATVAKGSKVESLMGEILKDVQVIACEKLEATATSAQVKELEAAIKEMKEMPSSLTDKAATVVQTHSGNGDNIGNFGPGALTINRAQRDVIQNHNETRVNIGSKE
jgi:hypothetical protein